MVVVVVLVVLIIVSQFIKCHNMAIVTIRVMFSVHYSYFEKWFIIIHEFHGDISLKQNFRAAVDVMY